MSTAIAEVGAGLMLAPDIAALQQASNFQSDSFKDIAGSGMNFLPRLQLFTSNSDQVKSMKINLAHYGIIKGKDTLIDLGKSVILIALAWRAKAMDVKAEPNPLAYFKQESPEFQEIVKSANEDSNSGKMYGPEFLVWIPDHGYCTFFFGSKTGRNVAPSLKALLPKANGQMQVAVVTAKFIEGKEYKWHGPEVNPSGQIPTSLPDQITLYPTIQEFLSPTDSGVTASTAAPADAKMADR